MCRLSAGILLVIPFLVTGRADFGQNGFRDRVVLKFSLALRSLVLLKEWP